MLDATNILNSCNNKLKNLLYDQLILAAKSINLTKINLTNDEDLSCMSRTAQYKKDCAAINNSIYSVAYKTKELIAQQEKLNTSLRIAILNTLPCDLYNAVTN